MPNILVPLDGTPHATVALPVAHTLAQLLDGSLHVLHVAARHIPPDALLQDLNLTPEMVQGTVLHLEQGSPAQAIERAARDWDDAVIVLCTHTGMEKPYGALGHVAEEVLRLSTDPIIFVQPERGHRPWVVDHILLPHDGTPSTAAGFAPSARLALRAHAELLVLHVTGTGGERPSEPGTYTVPPYIDQPQHEWPHWAQEFLERTGCMGRLPPELDLRLELARGEPGAEIVRYAKQRGTDLIVLAWRGHAEPFRATTLKAVIHGAPCPVAIYRIAAPEAPAEG